MAFERCSYTHNYPIAYWNVFFFTEPSYKCREIENCWNSSLLIKMYTENFINNIGT